MLVLTAADVERHLDIPACIPAMRSAMAQVSDGRALMPLRQFMAVPGAPGKLGLMPGWLAEPPRFGVKIVSKYVRPPGDPHGTHVGGVMLFDAATGLALALIEGGSLTAIRTAAASALATDLLARPGPAVVAVLGAGEQARRHVEAMRAVRLVSEVRIWARDPARAAAFAAEIGGAAAASVEAAVDGADIVCTTTSAAEPILEGRWIAAGTHINLVGSAIPTTAEADVALVAASRFIVDSRAAALAQAGELRRAIETGAVSEAHVAAEIGEVILGRAPGRTAPDEITIYKSLGVSAQDLAAADHLLGLARAAGAGVDIDF